MMADAAPKTPKDAVYDALFDAFDRGKDGALDFGDIVWALAKLGGPGQSLASARNAAVEALLLIGRGEAAIAPPSSATRGARRLDRADFSLLLDKVASMAGVDALEAAGKMLAQARRASFSLAAGGGGDSEGEGGSMDGGAANDEEEEAAVAREVAAVDRRDSLVDAADGAAGAAAVARAEEEEGEVMVLPDEEATAAAAAAVAAAVAGAGAGGDGPGGGGAGGAGAGGGATGAAAVAAADAACEAGGGGGSRGIGVIGAGKSPGRKALALATDPQLGLLFNAWCSGNGPSGGAGDEGGGGASGSGGGANNPRRLSLADVAQGLCRLRPPQTKEDVAATLAEAARAVARHDASSSGFLDRSAFAAFVSALLSAAGVAFGDAAGALLEVATARPPNEAMRRTLQAHGDLAARVLAEGRRGAREGPRE